MYIAAVLRSRTMCAMCSRGEYEFKEIKMENKELNEQEERNMQIKSVKLTGIVVMAAMGLLALSLVVLGVTISAQYPKRFAFLITAAVFGLLTALATGLTLLRVDKLKSRKSLAIGGACMLLGLVAMLTFAIIGLLIN